MKGESRRLARVRRRLPVNGSIITNKILREEFEVRQLAGMRSNFQSHQRRRPAAPSSAEPSPAAPSVPLTELLPLMFQDSSGHESASLYRENLQIRGWERERFVESEVNGALAKTTSTNVAVELCRGLGHQRSDAT